MKSSVITHSANSAKLFLPHSEFDSYPFVIKKLMGFLKIPLVEHPGAIFLGQALNADVINIEVEEILAGKILVACNAEFDMRTYSNTFGW